MPNQMIALQARNPQIADPSAQTAKYVNMMNMAKQQEAAQLQGERIRQEMEYARAGEARAVETQAATMREKDLDIEDKEMVRLYKIGAALLETEDPTTREAGYQNLLGLIEKTSPQLGATMRQVAGTFNPQVLQSVMMGTEQYFNKKYATPVTETIFGPDNKIYVAQKGGLNEGLRPLLNTPAAGASEGAPATPTAPATSTADAGVAMRATGGANTTPQDLIRQGMNPDNVPSGMPTSRPISFNQSDMGGANAGQMTPEVMSSIVDSAFQTGVMAQVDFDQLLATQPPQNKQALVDSFRRANITLQADAPSLADSAMGQQQSFAVNPVQTPQARFADMRGPAPQSQTAGLRGAPPMEQTLAQTNVLGGQAYGRSASPTSPLPGIYSVPTQDVAATAAAQRPSKQEKYDAKRAEIDAIRDAGPPPATPQQKRARQTEVAKAYTKTQALMDKAYNPKEGVIALANKIKALSDDQKESITGYSGYISSFRASSREADTLIGNLKGVVTGLGKDAAAASGAIGPMAVQEWKIVADMIAKLDLEGMTPRALDAQMNRIIEQVSNATNLAERVYDVQYGDDIKEYPDFKLKGAPLPRTKTPVVKGGSRISPDIDQILKSRGI
jgi:hypothetical protein